LQRQILRANDNKSRTALFSAVFFGIVIYLFSPILTLMFKPAFRTSKAIVQSSFAVFLGGCLVFLGGMLGVNWIARRLKPVEDEPWNNPANDYHHHYDGPNQSDDLQISPELAELLEDSPYRPHSTGNPDSDHSVSPTLLPKFTDDLNKLLEQEKTAKANAHAASTNTQTTHPSHHL